MNQKYKISVYKIYWNDCEDFYIGSTKLKLSRRMAEHRGCCRRGNTKQKIYNFMREKGVENFKYILIESYEVESNDEKRKWEQYHISELKSNLNMWRAYNTEEDYKSQKKISDKKYYKKNEDKIKTYKKEYYKKNIDKEKLRSIEWYNNNKDKAKDIREKYYEENKERIKNKTKQWYENTKDNRKIKSKEYYENNKDKIKEYREKNKESLRLKKKVYDKEYRLKKKLEIEQKSSFDSSSESSSETE